MEKLTSRSNCKNIFCEYGQVDLRAVLLVIQMQNLFFCGHSTFGIMAMLLFNFKLNHSLSCVFHGELAVLQIQILSSTNL